MIVRCSLIQPTRVAYSPDRRPSVASTEQHAAKAIIHTGREAEASVTKEHPQAASPNADKGLRSFPQLPEICGLQMTRALVNCVVPAVCVVGRRFGVGARVPRHRGSRESRRAHPVF